MTIKDIFLKYFSKIDSLDLELLIAYAIKKPREFVLAHPEYKIPSLKIVRRGGLKFKIARRMRGEPLAYILGGKEFYGLDFKVNKNTLIPRPETELLVELAIQELRITNNELSKIKNTKYQLPTTVVDVGTGSGNIIISLAKLLESRIMNQELRFFGTDISAQALIIAKQNAKTHKVDKKIKFLKGSLLEPILKTKNYKLKTTNYIILANLPYLDTAWKNLLKSSDTKGLKYEPPSALYAGKDGLDAYRKLATQIKSLVANYGLPTTVLCEIGHLQKRGMEKIFSFADKIEFQKDLAGKWRVCIINA